MPMKWKPDKARGSKRENKQKLKRQQERKEFAQNMERALQLFHDFSNGTKDADNFVSDVLGLEQKYVDWAISKFRHEKFKQPMNKLHQDMHDTWQEILTTTESCAKATAARTYPKRRAQQKRAAAAFRADRTQARLEAAARIGAKIQAKMQERAVC